MNELRAMLEEYVADINNILQTCKDDNEIREAASKKWQLKTDHRFLVFTEEMSTYRMTRPPEDAGGNDVHISNEMPAPGGGFTQSPPDTDAEGDKHLLNENSQSPSKK